jgi:threonine synthase
MFNKLSTVGTTPWPGVIAAYRDRLPVADNATPVTLLEGGTPLIHATRFSEQTGCTVHLKVEGSIPPAPSRIAA